MNWIWHPARELHLAGGVQRRGFHLDIHSNPTHDTTLTLGVSNLQTWSACLRAGATILTDLSRNSTLWSIGTLPAPQWLPEIGMDRAV
jgi:hypothetical protein